MSKNKLITEIYNHSFDGLDINMANELYNKAFGYHSEQVEKFNKYYDLYNKPNTESNYDRNLIFELIEAEIDNNRYFPKAYSLNGNIDASYSLESILKSILHSQEYREFNDQQERNTYIFGTSITYVYYDKLSRDSSQAGKIRFKAIDPRFFIPQHGIRRIQDMDYCFLIETCTKLQLANLYQLSTDEIRLLQADYNVLNIDTDLVTVKSMFYKDKYDHICRFTWSGQVVLEDDKNIYCEKEFVCDKCGKPKQADEDICIYCENTSFKLEDIKTNKVSYYIDGDDITETVNCIPYTPNSFPFVIRKNITTNEFYGKSDIDVLLSAQELTNSLNNKFAERILKSGSLLMIPKTLRNRLKPDNSELKILYYDTPAEASGIQVKALQPSIGNEIDLLNMAYANARNSLGITNTFQGREDNSAISSQAKQLQINQTAARLESKREMKKASLVQLFRVLFEFILAYCKDKQGYYEDIDGKEVFKVFDNRTFLIKDEDSKLYYDDEYIFDIDLSATYENDRERMWQETRLNLSSGAYGDPADPTTTKMFWQTMYRLHYPGAKEALSEIEDKIAEKQRQQNMIEAQKNRELQLQSQSQQHDALVSSETAKQQQSQHDLQLLNTLNTEK